MQALLVEHRPNIFNKIVKNSFCLDVRKNFFSNRVVDAWNELP